MPRSTFVGIRCLEQHARQRTNLAIWSRVYQPRARINTQPKTHTPPTVNRGDVWYLLRERKNAQFVKNGSGLRIKGSGGLRSRTRSSNLKTLHIAPAPSYQPTQRLAAPIFLAPILVFLKSSIIWKAGVAVVAVVKSSFVAKIFASAVAYLKSGTVFKTVAAVTRVSLAFITYLRLQGRRLLRWWHGHEHYERTKREYEAAGRTRFYPHFRRTTMVILTAPMLILGIAILASIERTPIWGRWRVIMMNADEEALLVEEFLKPGSPAGAHLDSTVQRDWLTILRASAGEEAGPPGTFMGMPVVDPRTDWRARWVMDVFSYLEDGVKRVNLTSENAKDGYNIVEFGSTRFAVPPVEYPLTVRSAALQRHGHAEDEHVEGPLITRYGCLVVDSPACNAFSLGFGPALKTDTNKNEEAPGVVVVFTGLLDEILRNRQNQQPAEPEKPPPAGSNALFGVFQQAVATSPQYPNMTVLPTKHETDQLASSLAHELGHLLLSHSLESLASTNMYELLGVLTTDIIRTVLYPLTAFLGPVFNDWFGEQIRINSALGLRVTSSCASRAAEIEADLLGLRILLGAGIDPRVALDDWAIGGLFDRAEQRENGGADTGKKEDDNWLERTGFGRSHPMNKERYRRIKEELDKWEQLGKTVSADGTGGKKVIENAERRTLPVTKAAPRAAATAS